MQFIKSLLATKPRAILALWIASELLVAAALAIFAATDSV